MKVCSQCGQTKPYEEFHRFIGSRDGRRAACIACSNAKMREYKLRAGRTTDVGPVSGTCAQCGAGFDYIKTTGPRRMYCSERCKHRGGRAIQDARAQQDVRRCICGSTEVARVGIPRCPNCRTERGRDVIRQRARERLRTLRLYNMTQGDWDAMVAKQGDRCAICRTDRPGGKGERWHIDHDHACCPGAGSCGRCVRGLLCHDCNVALGRMKDSPDLLRAAAAYLEMPRQPALMPLHT